MSFSDWITSPCLKLLYEQLQYLDPVEDPSQSFVRIKASTQIVPQSANNSIISSGNSSSSSYIHKIWNRPLATHLLLYLFTILFAYLGLQYHHTGAVNLLTLSACPYIVNHQVFLPVMWAQIDLCWYGVIVASFCAYASFVFNPLSVQRYKMILMKESGRLVIRRNELSKEDSDKICSFRARFKTPIFLTIIVFDLLAVLYLYFVVWYQALYRVHLVDALFWLVLFPRMVFNISFGLFGIMVFVIISSKYIQIRLDSILSAMIKLNGLITKRSYNSKYRLRSAWLEYTSLNRRLLSLCSDIDECTHFWSPYLSIMCPFFMWVQAYLSYITFFVDSIPFMQKFLFLYGMIEFDITLFVLIDQCARVVKLNQKILTEYRRFFIAIQQGRLCKQRIQNRHLLLAESLQISRRLHNFAFRLFGNYRITSKTFHLVISYMSIFLLLVIKSHKMKKKTSLI